MNKTCKVCQIEKSTDEFEKKYDRGPGGRCRSYCKECRKKKRRVKRTVATITWKEWAGGECVSCGYSKCLGAMDFHHRDPKTKKFSISEVSGRVRLGSEGKWAKSLEQEILKCDLLCANCHRELHHNVQQAALS